MTRIGVIGPVAPDCFAEEAGDTLQRLTNAVASARAVHTDCYVAREEKAGVLRSAVNVPNTMHPGGVSGVNARLFEATGHGAAVLTELHPAIPELFAVGKEVLASPDFDDLAEQATRLLNECGLTAWSAVAATQCAHRDHTYDRHFASSPDELS